METCICDNKMKFLLLGLTSGLYKEKLPELMDKLESFLGELKGILQNHCDILSYGPVASRAELDELRVKLDRENIAGVIVILLSYSPSLMSLPFLKEISKPILIWNTQKLWEIKDDFNAEDLLQNHGIHGVQDLASVLLRERVPFSLVTGHFKDECAQQKIKEWMTAVTAVERLRNSRVGNLGGTFPMMGDFLISPESLKSKLGVEFVKISMDEIADYLKKVEDAEIEKVMKDDLKKYKAENLSPETHRRSVRIELALRKLIEDRKLQGIAVNFIAFDRSSPVDTVPFLAISKFLAEGMGYGGEGDVLTACSVLLLQYLTGEANFVEMFTVDFPNNLIFMSHMAESNPKMARPDSPIILKENPLPLAYAAPSAVLCFSLRPGLATLLDFTQTSEGEIKVITSLVEVVDKPMLKNIDQPQFFIRPNCRVEEFLTKYSLEGGKHHLAMCYGDLRQTLKYVATLMNMPYVEI